MRILAISEDRSEKLTVPFQDHREFDIVELSETGIPICGILIGIYEVLKYVVTNKYDVVVSNRSGITGLLATLFGLLFSVHSVIRLGGNPWKTYENKLADIDWKNEPASTLKYVILIRILEFSIEWCDGIIVVSEHLKQDIISYRGIDKSKIEIVNTHQEPCCTHCQQVQSSGGNSLTITTVTNLEFAEKYKGLKQTINQIIPILSSHTDVHYYIAGGGRYYSSACEFLEDKEELTEGQKDRIHLLGHLEDVCSLYQRTDLFIYVSYFDAYPNVVLEAKAHNLPIITNYGHGMTEQITQYDTGILIQEVQEIPVWTSWLLGNKSIRNRMGSAAKREVLAENGPGVCKRKYIRAFKSFLEE